MINTANNLKTALIGLFRDNSKMLFNHNHPRSIAYIRFSLKEAVTAAAFKPSDSDVAVR